MNILVLIRVGKGYGTNGTISINRIAVLSTSGLNNIRLEAMLAPLEYPTATTSSTSNW